MKRILLICLLCLCLCLPALAEEERTVEAGEIFVDLAAEEKTVQVRSTLIDGENWLFLPAFADLASLYPDAYETEEDGVWYDDEAEMYLMQSENLRALFLFSDDPEDEGRAWVENCEDHENETTGSMALVGADGTVDCADDLRQLRGRGNSTWKLSKKPYQIKLENKTDLLNTGIKSEKSRTWVLLADAYDPTSLHNRIVLDLGLEIGMEEVCHSEHVDLYYDGEYRGLYLLSEKVEVDEARLDVGDYDDIIKALAKNSGVGDPDRLDDSWAEQETGLYSFIKDLPEPSDPAVGTYLLEMENEGVTLSDRCWFHLGDGSVLALKNPENASQNMVRYISNRLEEARLTLTSGGVNPKNGRTLHDDFDVDAFARNLLIQELAHSADGYTYSSSWFILPAGEKRFIPGGLWDFDLSLFERREGTNEGGMGLRAQRSWPEYFYGCDDFVLAMQRIYLDEVVPVVENILLGEEAGEQLKPFGQYVDEIAASRAMNERIWQQDTYFEYRTAEGFEQNTAQLRRFIEGRHAWLKQALTDAKPHSADTITLWGSAEYGHVDTNLQVHACTWNNVDIASCEWEMVSEATEDEYAVYELELILAPKAGYAFEDPSVTFGGKAVSHDLQDDGTLRVLVTFEDPSYRPVDYYGDDIGMVFNPDVYAASYPEIAAEYEDDPEGLMDYFCDEGMYEDHKGNAFFRPSEILAQNPGLEEMFGTDWQLYYWDFLYYGYDDGWLIPGMSPGFGLEVTDALE